MLCFLEVLFRKFLPTQKKVSVSVLGEKEGGTMADKKIFLRKIEENHFSKNKMSSLYITWQRIGHIPLLHCSLPACAFTKTKN